VPQEPRCCYIYTMPPMSPDVPAHVGYESPPNGILTSRWTQRAEVAEWQTRRSQKPLSSRACGFESHLRYSDGSTCRARETGGLQSAGFSCVDRAGHDDRSTTATVRQSDIRRQRYRTVWLWSHGRRVGCGTVTAETRDASQRLNDTAPDQPSGDRECHELRDVRIVVCLVSRTQFCERAIRATIASRWKQRERRSRV
jgi:hypothetical protein